MKALFGGFSAVVFNLDALDRGMELRRLSEAEDAFLLSLNRAKMAIRTRNAEGYSPIGVTESFCLHSLNSVRCVLNLPLWEITAVSDFDRELKGKLWETYRALRCRVFHTLVKVLNSVLCSKLRVLYLQAVSKLAQIRRFLHAL